MILYSDPEMSAREMRDAVFNGDLIMLTGLPAVSRLVEHTRRHLRELFAPHDPESAHEHFSPTDLAGILGRWKPAFIHDADSKRLVRLIIEQAGFDVDDTYYDLPKPRTSFPVGHLNSGVAFAFPWHRDAWYSAPPQQLNWWMPILGVTPQNAMTFDPAKFDSPVPNDSETFDYYRHNAARHTTATQISAEVQARPGAYDHSPDLELTVLPPPGSILLFAGTQLHRSIANTSGRSRFSIDFRTVDAADVAAARGAPLVDARCTGTAIRDFHRVSDGEGFDESLVRRVFGAPPPGVELVFRPKETEDE